MSREKREAPARAAGHGTLENVETSAPRGATGPVSLSRFDRRRILRFLSRDPGLGVYVQGFLEASAEDMLPGRFWATFLSERGSDMVGLLYLSHAGLAVPLAESPEAALPLARALSPHWSNVLALVGPLGPTDVLLGELTLLGNALGARLEREHVLLTLEAEQLCDGATEPGLRPAISSDVQGLIEASARMRYEELGEDILADNPEGFRRWIRGRIATGRAWIVRDDQGIAFKVDVGTLCSLGAQLEGVWVRPDRRREGLATRALRTLLRRLLRRADRVTLHVWEENEAALRCYAALGFRAHARYRVLYRR